jgi:hypothetical protein
MPNLQVWAVLANFLLDIQANRYATALDWVACPCARERVRVRVRVRVKIY